MINHGLKTFTSGGQKNVVYNNINIFCSQKKVKLYALYSYEGCYDSSVVCMSADCPCSGPKMPKV